MNKILALFILVFCSITNAISNDLSDLEYNDIDPITSYHYNNHEKEHDKRTVFHSPHRNYGLAKHVGLHPAGFKYVLGYSGVDLRYIPVIRPVSYRSPHYHYHRLKLKRPLLLRPLLTARPHYQHIHHTKPVLDSTHGHGYWKPEAVKPEHHVIHEYHPPATVTNDHHHHHQAVIHNHHPHQEVIHDHHSNQALIHDHHPHQAVIDDHHSHQAVIQDHHPHQTVIHDYNPHQTLIHDHHPHQTVVHDHHPHQTILHDHHSHHGVIHDHHPNHAVIHGHHPHVIPEVHQSPFLLHPPVSHPHAVQVRPIIPGVQFPVSSPAHLHPVAQVPHLFEVTKPNLPVLPLGTSFPTSILQQAFQQAAAISPDLYHLHNIKQLIPSPVVPQAVLRHPVPVPQPFVPQQVIPQALFPQPQVVVPRPAQASNVYPPGTVVEYHGTRHFVPINGRIPILTQGNVFHRHPVNVVPQETPFRPILPPQEHHGVQTPLLPANHPNFIQDHLSPGFISQQLPDVTHQQPPLHQVNAQEFHHQVLSQHPSFRQYSQQIPEDHKENEAFHNIGHQDLPTGNQQPTSLFTEQFPVENSLSQENEEHKVIQPGQTDLQLPLHLPAHPNYFPSNNRFIGGNFHDPQQHPEKVLRPTSSLEPPYN